MSPEQFSDREKALCSYLERFLTAKEKEGVKLTLNIKEAANSICSLYDRYLEEVIRPSVKSGSGNGSGTIQNYKIIANTELAILRVAPFATTEETKKALNAELALFVATCMLIEWNSLDEPKADQLFKEDAEIKSFLKEHLTWLILLDIRFTFPGFSNSQVWRLFHYLVRDRIKNI